MAASGVALLLTKQLDRYTSDVGRRHQELATGRFGCVASQWPVVVDELRPEHCPVPARPPAAQQEHCGDVGIRMRPSINYLVNHAESDDSLKAAAAIFLVRPVQQSYVDMRQFYRRRCGCAQNGHEKRRWRTNAQKSVGVIGCRATPCWLDLAQGPGRAPVVPVCTLPVWAVHRASGNRSARPWSSQPSSLTAEICHPKLLSRRALAYAVMTPAGSAYGRGTVSAPRPAAVKRHPRYGPPSPFMPMSTGHTLVTRQLIIFTFFAALAIRRQPQNHGPVRPAVLPAPAETAAWSAFPATTSTMVFPDRSYPEPCAASVYHAEGEHFSTAVKNILQWRQFSGIVLSGHSRHTVHIGYPRSRSHLFCGEVMTPDHPTAAASAARSYGIRQLLIQRHVLQVCQPF